MTNPNNGRIRKWSTAVLAVYWVALFAATHWPRPPRLITSFTNADKAIHFLGFAILAGLLGYWWSARWRFGWLAAIAAIVLLAGYAAIDEWTQPWVGRHCSPYDWCADMLGSCVGIAGIAAAGIVMARRGRVRAQ